MPNSVDYHGTIDGYLETKHILGIALLETHSHIA